MSKADFLNGLRDKGMNANALINLPKELLRENGQKYLIFPEFNYFPVNSIQKISYRKKDIYRKDGI